MTKRTALAVLFCIMKVFHVKQSALAIFDSFLGAAFVRMKHEA